LDAFLKFIEATSASFTKIKVSQCDFLISPEYVIVACPTKGGDFQKSND